MLEGWHVEVLKWSRVGTPSPFLPISQHFFGSQVIKLSLVGTQHIVIPDGRISHCFKISALYHSKLYAFQYLSTLTLFLISAFTIFKLSAFKNEHFSTCNRRNSGLVFGQKPGLTSGSSELPKLRPGFSPRQSSEESLKCWTFFNT